MSQVVNNSCQPCIDFTQWCKKETSNLFAPLPQKGAEESRLGTVIRRIVFVCSLILPLIGLIAMLASECYRDVTVPPKPQPTSPPPPAAALVVPEKAGVTVRSFRDSIFLLSTIDPENFDQEVLETYLGLREAIKKVDDPLKIKTLELRFDCVQALERIDELDKTANAFLESQGKPRI